MRTRSPTSGSARQKTRTFLRPLRFSCRSDATTHRRVRGAGAGQSARGSSPSPAERASSIGPRQETRQLRVHVTVTGDVKVWSVMSKNVEEYVQDVGGHGRSSGATRIAGRWRDQCGPPEGLVGGTR